MLVAAAGTCDADRFGFDAGGRGITHKNGLAMSFGRFVKLAVPFAALQIALATVYVLPALR